MYFRDGNGAEVMFLRFGIFSLLRLEQAEAVVIVGHLRIIGSLFLLAYLEDLLQNSFRVGIKTAPVVGLGDFLLAVECLRINTQVVLLLRC